MRLTGCTTRRSGSHNRAHNSLREVRVSQQQEAYRTPIIVGLRFNEVFLVTNDILHVLSGQYSHWLGRRKILARHASWRPSSWAWCVITTVSIWGSQIGVAKLELVDYLLEEQGTNLLIATGTVLRLVQRFAHCEVALLCSEKSEEKELAISNLRS